MEKLIFIAALFLFSINSNAQNEKITIGEVCYFSEVESGGVQALTTEVYTYHGKIELKFGDYQITVDEEEKSSLLSILNQYEAINEKSQSEGLATPQLIDNYSPHLISYTNKVIDPEKLIKIYYCKELRETKSDKGNLIIKIPELNDMFGGGSADEKYLYFTGECLVSLKEVLR